VGHARCVVARVLHVAVSRGRPRTQHPGDGAQALVDLPGRTALSDIGLVEHQPLVATNTVVSQVRHTGPMVFQDGDTLRVAPPTGRRFDVEHVHWTEFDDDGRADTHFARWDDLGQVTQLGLLPQPPEPCGAFCPGR